ncbi:aldo/keto reductase [Pseudomonas fluorescens]|uniref:Aldo/keto reductase n=2 Tax=Pseudomonas fluorescens TaxID=294 RepID=A0A1T2YCM9_PSEFL|nr:aldo/keto reductase [Pseudomonas fluorescens]
MTTRRLGKNGPVVSALGMGCMAFRMGDDETERGAVRTLQSALDSGFSFLNTGDFYGSGQSEMLVGRALKGRRDDAFLSVKCGAQVDPNGRIIGLDGRPNSIKNFAAYSLKRLGVDVIDMYQPGRADPDVPYEETIGAIADLINDGKVRYLGVSEVGADLLRRAHAVHPVTALEIEYSLASRFIERDILPTARELGIGVVAYRILAEGMLGGNLPQGQPPADSKFLAPRMHGDNYTRNMATAQVLEAMAVSKGFTAAQLAVAWVLSRGDDIVPLAGINRPSRISDNLRALEVKFTALEASQLESAFAPDAVVGLRYPEFVLKWAAQ